MVLKDIQIAFNKKLVDARATKISYISKIAEMKTRIFDLHKILLQPGEYPWPNLNEVVDVSLCVPLQNFVKMAIFYMPFYHSFPSLALKSIVSTHIKIHGLSIKVPSL